MAEIGFLLPRLREVEAERDRLREALEGLVAKLVQTSPGHLDTPAGKRAIQELYGPEEGE